MEVTWRVIIREGEEGESRGTVQGIRNINGEDGGNIGGSGVHFPPTPGKYLADLRSRANSQQYSSIYED